jgi:hypothetical protein
MRKLFAAAILLVYLLPSFSAHAVTLNVTGLPGVRGGTGRDAIAITPPNNERGQHCKRNRGSG